MTAKILPSRMKLAAKHTANGQARAAEIVINGTVHIPGWVVDHDSFRCWALSEDFPERGRIFFLDDEIWADLSMETLIHNQIKNIFGIILGSIVLDEGLGTFFPDRMMLKNADAGLSCEPEGMFVSNASMQDGLVTLEDGDRSLEVIGSPDMTLEVISKTSMEKDTVILKELYARANVKEYWLVDSTIDVPELVILRLVNGKYVSTRKHFGWVSSKVYGRSFRLTCEKDGKGTSHFNLKTK